MLNRIKQYIDSKDITIALFERSIGMSNASFGKSLKTGGAIGSDKIEKILSVYTDINPTWLLTGKGTMLIDQNQIPEEIKTASKQNEENEGVVAYLQQQLKEKDARIETLIAENAVLRHRLQNVRV